MLQTVFSLLGGLNGTTDKQTGDGHLKDGH